MATALSRRRRQEEAPYWPGFVDAMAQLLLVITFLLSVFMIAQFLLARQISGKDSALGQLRSQIAELTQLLALEKGAKSLNAKVREAQVDLIPYMFVVGEKDRDQGTVAVRDRLAGDLGPMPLAAAIAKLQDEIAAKTVRQVAAGEVAALGDRNSEHEY